MDYGVCTVSSQHWFVLVDGTSSGKLNFTGVGMRGVYDINVVDFSRPRPAVEAGDLFAVMI